MRNIFWFLIEAVWYMPRFYILMLRRLWYHREKHSERHWWHKGAYHAQKRALIELKELKTALDTEYSSIYMFNVDIRKGHTRQDEAGDVACFMLFVAMSPLMADIIDMERMLSSTEEN